ncbi:MAG: sigma-70 family RNA polymerase sigma factor [Hymenobacteraceae bacterium]|nr:sigma-70 family RNA polymerase sigma factor [Hymenobacteraceae bacterium]MDX5396155.1 sigma-70 family RNA polymerase sigma factor [Hymenobacteraceae bacterium]MDX5443047.1 sigma-70 family RNA polymerase sigma factor [Hymenobacteraceae bacterium]MDX5512218.1 sigma-70 family RNA polymerase sigma factor [Hymenobacteraceae bacterium]
MEINQEHIDKELIEGCRKGDLKFQKLLYKQFYGFALSVCMRYVDNRDEASEILNDGFMKVFTNIGNFDQGKSFKGWIRRIMVNTAIDHYRKNKHHYSTLDLVYADSETTTEDVMEKISAAEIMAMVQQLSPSYRMVFNLYVMEGYTHPEIAEKLEITEGASKSNLHKARVKLQKMINLYYDQKHSSYAR